MKRTDFIQIIKLRSIWKVDRRRGNYKLPNGERLSRYITDLVDSQMRIDNLGIRENGDLCLCAGGDWNNETNDCNDYVLMPEYDNNEVCTFEDMGKRIKSLVFDIIG